MRRPAALSVAFPYAPVGPRAVGGAEVVCSLVEAAVPQQLDLDSVVVAHATSEPAGKLYPTTIPPGLITEATREVVEARHQANIDRAFAENEIRLVHMHGLDFHRYRIPNGVPVVVTLHLPPEWYPRAIWQLDAQYRLVCVSESQRQRCPREVQERVGVVENGVPLPKIETLRDKGRYALMLARICAEKNLHAGFDAGRLAGMPVLLGGDVFPYEAHERYFAEEIEPRLTSSGAGHEDRQDAGASRATARFLGPVAGAEKQRMLQRAACLLLPSLAPETSSMVAMEALAAGVPVIGMAVGAVPTIIEDGRTGFLIEPGERLAERMADAMGRLGEINRTQCRAAAETRFAAAAMVERYLQVYKELIVPHVSHPGGNACAKMPRVDGLEVPFAPLRIAELRERTALEALEGEWAELWARDPQATPFQHPAWLLPWWRQFGPDGELSALVVRDRQDVLVGWVPTYQLPATGEAERKLLLMGAGTSDYLGGVWAPECAGAAAQQALHFMHKELRGYQIAALQQQRSGSALCEAALAGGFAVGDSEPCSRIVLADDLPAKVRVNGNRYRHMAERQGALGFEVLETEADVLAGFGSLVQFHGERWRRRGETGVLKDGRVLAHHTEGLPALLRAGLLRFFRLQLAGETIGVLYGLTDGPRAAERSLYLYLIGFSRQAEALSPGSLLLRGAWEHAREQGFTFIDLLRGGESYKRLWGARTERTQSLAFQPEQA